MAEVIWTEPALNALDEIADHIALDDDDAACRFVGNVFAKVDLLEENSKLGNKPKDLRNRPYRTLLIQPAYVYYRIEEEQVIILFVERGK